MLSAVKSALLKDPDKLTELLEQYGFCGIKRHGSYISFGRDSESSYKSVVIYTNNNDSLIVRDYARNITVDLFGYIMKQRAVSFREILGAAKRITGLTDYYRPQKSTAVFGGIYRNIRKSDDAPVRTYPESELDKYIPCGNKRFLRDNISLEAQRFFGICYDPETQGIVIPIRSPAGDLMGIKIRFNKDIRDGELKYFYSLPCPVSKTLYGYSENYAELTGGTILVFEAEKSVMQCRTYGIYNAVAMGSGTISKRQVNLLLELDPQKIILLHDIGYEREYVKRNLAMIADGAKYKNTEIGCWDSFNKHYPDKLSPSDSGADFLKNVLDNEIEYVKGDY